MEEIETQLKKEGVYGQFFPNYFAACSYDDSLAGFYWPLTQAEQETQGYRTTSPSEKMEAQFSFADEIPDSSLTATDSVTEK